jgi:hypothetical protein
MACGCCVVRVVEKQPKNDLAVKTQTSAIGRVLSVISGALLSLK